MLLYHVQDGFEAAQLEEPGHAAMEIVPDDVGPLRDPHDVHALPAGAEDQHFNLMNPRWRAALSIGCSE